MSYEVLILRRAQKQLADLPKADYGRVRDAVAALADNPRPVGCKKLTGREGWRIRSGDYRVIYEIEDVQRKVTVLHIGHRRDVYS
ncbi:MAG: type II toxin-antitoxin system RelE/ParE family toxin [Pyrinomonadaceae bacterium]